MKTSAICSMSILVHKRFGSVVHVGSEPFGTQIGCPRPIVRPGLRTTVPRTRTKVTGFLSLANKRWLDNYCFMGTGFSAVMPHGPLWLVTVCLLSSLDLSLAITVSIESLSVLDHLYCGLTGSVFISPVVSCPTIVISGTCPQSHSQ
jgi:hypothetical protein